MKKICATSFPPIDRRKILRDVTSAPDSPTRYISYNKTMRDLNRQKRSRKKINRARSSSNNRRQKKRDEMTRTGVRHQSLPLSFESLTTDNPLVITEEYDERGPRRKNRNENFSMNTTCIVKTIGIYIACSEFRDESMRPIPNAVDEAKELEKMLSKDWQVETFATLYNEQVTRSNILNIWERLTKRINKMNSEPTVKIQLFVYIANHGFRLKHPNPLSTVMMNSSQNVYLPMYDSTMETLFSTGLRLRECQELARYSSLSHQLFCIDACYSGTLLFQERGGSNTSTSSRRRQRTNIGEIILSPASQFYVQSLLQRQAILGLCSSTHDRTSIDTFDPERLSIFTKSLMMAFESHNKEKYITIHQLFQTIQKKTFLFAYEMECQQLPVLGNLVQQNEGSFVFFKS